MKKFLTILGLYFLLIIFGNSCGPEEIVFINDIRFESCTIKDRKEDRAFNNYVETKIFKNDVVFAIQEQIETVASLNLGLVEKCYATTFAKKFNNSILIESFSLKLNKEFTFNNQVISANQNLFTNTEIKNQISVFKSNQAFGDIIIEFNPSFMSEAIFVNGIYQIEFECKTTDNRVFNKIIEVTFEN